MKKIALLVIVLAFGAAVASAETVKQAGTDAGNFWSREAKRAGWSDSTSNGWGKFWENANPVNFFKNQKDAYDARKASSGGSMSGATTK